MYLTPTTIYDARNDEWLGKQNGMDFLMAKPSNDGYISIKGRKRENYRASRSIASQLKHVPVVSSFDDIPQKELLKQYACAIAFDRAACKRNAEIYKALNDGDAFVVLYMKDWLRDKEDASKVVYKHVRSSGGKKQKPYALMHRDTLEPGNGYTEFTMPNGNILVLSVAKFNALQEAVTKAIALGEFNREEYFNAAGFVLQTMLRVMSVLPECEVMPFDYASKTWVVSTPKVRVSLGVNSLDLVDLMVEVGDAVREYSDLNIFMESVVLAEGMFGSTVSYVNDPILSVYDALTELSGARKAKTKAA